ncbi:serine/threonine-protein phosphatase PGAM5, mitochondrial isoform X2 [Boleophthalmus pectinirostris]|uniref:serine/threonine-protein phosphatase PGAM5, mitochondrial isoform X2 n=1 Tax=Boleophthalmus pectinirostris TaxID=150288 RepID=UPI000A1C1E6E|nr:serine/threonine-protein phosphatase PGAM5, mitochondrial isoform X2 [Boleophthalmus pectinirostris]
MAYRRTVKLLCGLAGGSAALAVAAVAAAAADSHGYFGGGQPGDGTSRWILTVIKAAQPAWTPSSHTPAPSGHAWDSNWDKRDPSSLINGRKKESLTEDPSSEQENSKPKATRNILLIRHSQYNLSGTTDKERFLTPLGREQAELTGQRLAALGLKYDLLIHSSMTRATETANIISKHLPGVDLVSCDLLREGAPIEPVPPVTHWKPDAVYHEDGARIEAAFRRYIHRADPKQKEDSYEIIVCHANVIRYFVCRALQFPPEGWLRMGLNNGSITWLTIRPSGRVALRTLGDSGFMPPDKLTRT